MTQPHWVTLLAALIGSSVLQYIVTAIAQRFQPGRTSDLLRDMQQELEMFRSIDTATSYGKAFDIVGREMISSTLAARIVPSRYFRNGWLICVSFIAMLFGLALCNVPLFLDSSASVIQWWGGVGYLLLGGLGTFVAICRAWYVPLLRQVVIAGVQVESGGSWRDRLRYRDAKSEVVKVAKAGERYRRARQKVEKGTSSALRAQKYVVRNGPFKWRVVISIDPVVRANVTRLMQNVEAGRLSTIGHCRT